MPLAINGTGTQLYYWPPRRSALRKLLPINITGITHNGVIMTSIETTHLLTELPDDGNQFGSRTYIQGEHGDPGELALVCQADPNIIPPRGVFVVQAVFPRILGYTTRPRWTGLGFFTLFGGFSVGVDALVTTNMTIKLSGNVTITRALKGGGQNPGP